MESVLLLLFPEELSVAELVCVALCNKSLYSAAFCTENNFLSTLLAHKTGCGLTFDMPRFQRKMRRKWVCSTCLCLTRNTTCVYRRTRRRRLCHACIQLQLLDRKQTTQMWLSTQPARVFRVVACQVPTLLAGVQLARVGPGAGHKHLYWKEEVEQAMEVYALRRTELQRRR